MTASDLPEFTLGKTLTAEQLAFFDKYGCIRFRGVATDAEVDTLRSALDELEQRFIAEERTTVMGTPLRIGKKLDGGYHNMFQSSVFSFSRRAARAQESCRKSIELV